MILVGELTFEANFFFYLGLELEPGTHGSRYQYLHYLWIVCINVNKTNIFLIKENYILLQTAVRGSNYEKA